MVKKEVIIIKKILLDFFKKKKISLFRIIIFGSYIKGKMHTYSDIDIILISKSFRNKDIFERADLMNGLNYELVHKIKKPFDLMYYSDTEWKNSNGIIINEAKSMGKVIYKD